MGNKLITGLFLVAIFIFGTPAVLAQEEDESRCRDARPATAPILTAATPGEKSVTLTWIEAADPLTHYRLIFSTDEYTEQYGNLNIGGRGTTTYTVTELQNGVKYYFKVRGVNHCRDGKFSNKLSATPGQAAIDATKSATISKKINSGPKLSIYKEVLGASTSASASASATPSAIPHVAVANIVTETCSACFGLPLWIVEILLLILYFSFLVRIPALKPVFSVIIPFILALIFFKLGGNCTNEFACKYYMPLNIVIFILMVVVYKQKFFK